MKNNHVLEALHDALQFTTGHVVLCNEAENYYTVAFGRASERFTVFVREGFAMAWPGGWNKKDDDLMQGYYSFGEKHHARPFGNEGSTCKWLVHRMLGQDIPVPAHLREPRHEAVCRFLSSIDSLPTKSIGGLSFVGTAAVMAADALEGRPDDWVNETTREQRVAILYGVFAVGGPGLKNEEVVEAIRALEKLEPGPGCLACSQSPEDK